VLLFITFKGRQQRGIVVRSNRECSTIILWNFVFTELKWSEFFRNRWNCLCVTDKSFNFDNKLADAGFLTMFTVVKDIIHEETVLLALEKTSHLVRLHSLRLPVHLEKYLLSDQFQSTTFFTKHPGVIVFSTKEFGWREITTSTAEKSIVLLYRVLTVERRPSILWPGSDLRCWD